MKRFVSIIIITATALVGISSCTKGPSGPDPGSELVIRYTVGNLNIPVALTKSAEMIFAGDSIRMTNVHMMADSIINAEARFDVTMISPFADPDLIVRFANGIPTTPGTYSFEPTKINWSSGPNVIVTQGVIIRQNGIVYYPVEGSIVLTEVRRNSNGTIAGIKGYCTGKVRAHWPAGFSSSPSNPTPPGYDMANPSLVGEHLTIHSCIFNNQTISAGTPRQASTQN